MHEGRGKRKKKTKPHGRYGWSRHVTYFGYHNEGRKKRKKKRSRMDDMDGLDTSLIFDDVESSGRKRRSRSKIVNYSLDDEELDEHDDCVGDDKNQDSSGKQIESKAEKSASDSDDDVEFDDEDSSEDEFWFAPDLGMEVLFLRHGSHPVDIVPSTPFGANDVDAAGFETSTLLGVKDPIKAFVGDVVVRHVVQPAHVSLNVHLVPQSLDLVAHHDSHSCGVLRLSHPPQLAV
eukprot:CAMPEP_0171323566 /NCGR_PEP_ID=MMETSP0816-20121228/115654_1 /TAXON_ID=420281 /ORGANISM="Proboscia inermis, Strain CCAP1064/1" /LENGTH=232 /DNA_ID=CAMNT_0011822305 /DNA_START=343 /DNA_END=1041 /DNA_ORIENTATION=+